MILITALMSVYNAENFIAETIKSVLEQSYSNFEFIIVNDGSIDDTVKVINSFKDTRIRLYNLEVNSGIAAALNYGISKSRGEYIIKIDADDIQNKNRFEKQLRFMFENPRYVLTKTAFRYFSEENGLKSIVTGNYSQIYKNSANTPELISKRLKWHCCIAHSTIMIKADVLKKYYYNNLPISEDYDLFFRMNEEGQLMGHLDECLVDVRISKNSVSQMRKHLIDECAYIIKEKVLLPFKKNESIYIWGSGDFGKSVLKTLSDRNWRIKGFIDSDPLKEDQLISGYRIYSSEIIGKDKYNKVIIASQPGMIDITNYLDSAGYISEIDYIVFR